MKTQTDIDRAMSDAPHDFQFVLSTQIAGAGLPLFHQIDYCARCGTMRRTETVMSGPVEHTRYGPLYYSTLGDWSAAEEPTCVPVASSPPRDPQFAGHERCSSLHQEDTP